MNARQAAGSFGVAILLCLVVPFAVYAVPGSVGAEQSFVVLSGSMEPAIDAGDVVLVDEVPPETIREGDVITFVRGEAGQHVTHRVVGVSGTDEDRAFETKGDANREADRDSVPARDVVGVVSVTIPLIGYVIQFANSTVGLLALVVAPLSLLVLWEVWSLVATDRDEDDADETPAAGGTESSNGQAPQANGPNRTTRDVDIDGSDLTVTTTLLALLTPYLVYVAAGRLTPLSLAVAFAAGFTLLAAGGVWVSNRIHRRGFALARSAPDRPRGPDRESEPGDRTPAGDPAEEWK